MVELYLRSPTRDHGLVRNELSAETNLPLTLPGFPVRECQLLKLSCTHRKTGGGVEGRGPLAQSQSKAETLKLMMIMVDKSLGTKLFVLM
jgi:hypothetical protein